MFGSPPAVRPSWSLIGTASLQKLARPVRREALCYRTHLVGRLPARLDYAADFDRARPTGAQTGHDNR